MGCGGYTRHPSPQPRTQRLTRRNTGVSDGGAITTLGAFCAVRKPCAAGCQNGILCRFLALVGCVPEERGEPAGQRCAYARRCSEAARPRWAAWSHCCFSHRTDGLHGFAQPHRCAQKIERLFFSYSGAFLEPMFASIHARNLSLGTTIRLPILSAGNPLLRASS